MPAGLAPLVVSGVMSVLAYVVGEETWHNITYETRVEACVEKVEIAFPNAPLQTMQQAELNCRKALQ